MKKSLAVIIENYVAGGANKYAEDLIYCLKDNFSSIDIYGNAEALNTFSKERFPSQVILNKIQIFNAGELIKNYSSVTRKFMRLILTPLFFFLNLLSLIKLKLSLNQKEPNLVLLCNGGYPASLYLDMASFFINAEYSPTMTIVSTPIRKENIFLEPFWKFLDNSVYTKNRKIVVNSVAIKNALCKDYHFPEKKIYILKNGVQDNPLNRQDDNETITIGFISRIEEAKGIKETLAAYKILKNKHQNLKLVVAGSGSLSGDVETAAKSDNSISYLGHVTTGLSELLHTLDIYVLPSYQEGLPYSIIEASMAGCAIIATNVGGIPELIENQRSGILIPHKDAEALFCALENLVTNADERKTYAANARRNFIINLSLDKMAEDARKILL